jgi:hypothetical protein
MDGLKQLMSALDLDDALNAAREIDLDNVRPTVFGCHFKPIFNLTIIGGCSSNGA